MEQSTFSDLNRTLARLEDSVARRPSKLAGREVMHYLDYLHRRVLGGARRAHLDEGLFAVVGLEVDCPDTGPHDRDPIRIAQAS